MNENIKKLILELSELAVGHDRFRLSINGSTVIVMVAPKSTSFGWDWCYYDCIYLPDEDTENRLKTALKFIKSLGGNDNENCIKEIRA